MVIELNPHQVCPFGSFCMWSKDCRGLDPDRSSRFLCELWAENYRIGDLEDARDD